MPNQAVLFIYTTSLVSSYTVKTSIGKYFKTKNPRCVTNIHLIQCPNSVKRASLEINIKSQSTAIKAIKYEPIWQNHLLEVNIIAAKTLLWGMRGLKSI